MKDYQREYKKRIRKLQVDLFPTDQELIDWIDQHKPIATTIKNLIKEQIEKEKRGE